MQVDTNREIPRKFREIGRRENFPFYGICYLVK